MQVNISILENQKLILIFKCVTFLHVTHTYTYIFKYIHKYFNIYSSKYLYFETFHFYWMHCFYFILFFIKLNSLISSCFFFWLFILLIFYPLLFCSCWRYFIIRVSINIVFFFFTGLSFNNLKSKIPEPPNLTCFLMHKMYTIE